MRKLKLYIAMSLNGMIARKDGDVNWLHDVPNPLQSDYGYADFYKQADTTIQGYNTFLNVKEMGHENPYPDTVNYVFTARKDRTSSDGFEFVTEDHVEFTKNLKASEGKDIWLIGGGQLNDLMLSNGLIDEAWIFIMPIVMPDGIRLFGSNSFEQAMTLKESITYSSGVTCLKYLIGSSEVS